MCVLNEVWLFATSLVLVWSSASARIYSKTILVSNMEVPYFFHLSERGFGFLKGGDVLFSMNCPLPLMEAVPDFWLLFCSTSDSREFSRMTVKQLDFECRRLKAGGTEMARRDAYCQRHKVDNVTAGQYEYYRKLHNDYFYSIILLQCPDYDFEGNLSSASMSGCQSRLLALNPGEVHLSSDEIPMPVIYKVISLLWAKLLCIWFFNWVIYWKYSNRLHRLISCAPMFKVLLVVLTLLWWQEIASTGMESPDITAVKQFVQSIEDALLFVTMMVIAEGWGVVRCHIKHYRWTSLLLLFTIFAVSLMCLYWVHKYFLAFSVCCIVFMMYKTLKWSSHNIELLRRRRRKIRRFISRHNLRYKGSATIDLQLYEKLKIYHRFRIVCAAFSMVYAIARTLSAFLHEYTYIRALAFEIPELLVYVATGWLLRLRNFEPFETIELMSPRENVVVIELPDVCEGEVAPHVQLGVPVQHKVEKETQTPRRRWHSSIR